MYFSMLNHLIRLEPDQLLPIAVGLGSKRARFQHVYSILLGKDLDAGKFSGERRDIQSGVVESERIRCCMEELIHEQGVVLYKQRLGTA